MKLKVKRKMILFGIVLVLGILVYGSVAIGFGSFLSNEVEYWTESPELDMVLDNKDGIISALEKIDPTEKVAKVNNEDVLVKDVILPYILYSTSGRQVTLRDKINERITQELYYLEAEKRGLTTSYKEAEEFMNYVRKNSEKDKEWSQILEMSISFYSSADEYWESTIPQYQKSLSVGKLREQIGDNEKFEALGKQLLIDANKEAKITYMPAVENRLERMPELQAIGSSRE